MGDWRLELTSELDIEPASYAVTRDGLVAPMHGIARTTAVEGETVHRVPILGPGDGGRQMSWLRLVNPGSAPVNVTIRGHDDAGQPAPDGEVFLSLPAGGARTLTAKQLEEGDVALFGRLGDGAGNWRLSVVADGAMEVLSLRRSAVGHLSNLSTTSPAVSTRFVIASDAPATVRPLQTISLSVAGGLSEADYTVLMDLSGNGSFDTDDTIEVEAVTTGRNRLLLAAPMTQVFPDGNAAREFAVRVRRTTDRLVSNTLYFSIEDFEIPASLAGYPSTMLEVFLKAIYSSSADPLLQLEAPSIRPGLLAGSARQLDLDTTIPDVQAEAILHSVFGLSPAEWMKNNASQPRGPAADTGSADRLTPQFVGSEGPKTSTDPDCRGDPSGGSAMPLRPSLAASAGSSQSLTSIAAPPMTSAATNLHMEYPKRGRSRWTRSPASAGSLTDWCPSWRTMSFPEGHPAIEHASRSEQASS